MLIYLFCCYLAINDFLREMYNLYFFPFLNLNFILFTVECLNKFFNCLNELSKPQKNTFDTTSDDLNFKCKTQLV